MGKLSDTYRAYIASVNDREIDRVSGFFADRMTYNDRPMTIEEYKQALRDTVAAVPDMRYEVEQTVEDADALAVVIRDRGTPVGTLRGLAPTGAAVEFQEYAFYRFEDGKIVASRTLWDMETLRAQLR